MTVPLFRLEWGHCELTAQGSDFLSNKQIRPQICCLCTHTGAIHFQSDIQADRTGNHNELFTLRSFCAASTTPRHLPHSWNNYNSCSGVLSLNRRAVAEVTGDVGVILSGGCGWMGWWLSSSLITPITGESINYVGILRFSQIHGYNTSSLRWINLFNFKFVPFWHWTRCWHSIISQRWWNECDFPRNKTFPDFHFLSESTLYWAICGVLSFFPWVIKYWHHGSKAWLQWNTPEHPFLMTWETSIIHVWWPGIETLPSYCRVEEKQPLSFVISSLSSTLLLGCLIGFNLLAQILSLIICRNTSLLYYPGRLSSLFQTQQIRYFTLALLIVYFTSRVLRGVPAAPRENDRNSLSCRFLLPVMQSCFPLITLKGQGLQRHISFGYSSQKLPQRDYELELSRQLPDLYW